MAEPRKVVVAALQFACSDSVSENVETAERLVRAAHKKGANIILIQELFEGYYFCQAQRSDFFQRAKPYKGHPTISRMQKLAKELGVVIPVSFFEEANNAHYNSIAIIDADGTDLGLYRKSHIPDGPGYQEKFYFNPGDTGFQVFMTKFAKIGVAICWDQWFPEAARAMVLQGAEILFYPTAIGSEPQDDGLDSREHWKRVMQGHAGANLVPLVASNRVGKEKIETEHGDSVVTFYGNSFIAGPSGDVVALANDKDEDILVAEFDLNKIQTQRQSWGVFRDRRPDLYKVSAQQTILSIQSSQPTPQASETPGQLESNAKRGRSGNFTIEEDVHLVSSWLNTSFDAVHETGMKHKPYWPRVCDFYHKYKNFPSDRNEKSLSSRWSQIQITTNKFCGCLAQIEARQQNGKDQQDKIAEARRLYQETTKKQFLFDHCWVILRHEPKWLEDCQKRKSNKYKHCTPSPSSPETPVDLDLRESPIDTGEDDLQDNVADMNRLTGRKAGKKRLKKRKGTDLANGSSIVALLQEMREEKKQFNEKKMNMFEKTYLQEQERLALDKMRLDNEQKRVTLDKKIHLQEQMKEEERIMLIDTTGMPSIVAEFYHRRQREIMTKESEN